MIPVSGVYSGLNVPSTSGKLSSGIQKIRLEKMKVLDLFSGLGGASAAFRLHGARVTTLDNNPVFKSDICCDIRHYHTYPGEFDFIWASPPCVEYSRKFMKSFYPYDPEPDMDLYRETQRVIREGNPQYWVIENVVGAIPYFGQPRVSYRPWFFWGFFPLPALPVKHSNKQSKKYKKPEMRAKIPYYISEAFYRAITSQLPLFDTRPLDLDALRRASA